MEEAVRGLRRRGGGGSQGPEEERWRSHLSIRPFLPTRCRSKSQVSGKWERRGTMGEAGPAPGGDPGNLTSAIADIARLALLLFLLLLLKVTIPGITESSES